MNKLEKLRSNDDDFYKVQLRGDYFKPIDSDDEFGTTNNRNQESRFYFGLFTSRTRRYGRIAGLPSTIHFIIDLQRGYDAMKKSRLLNEIVLSNLKDRINKIVNSNSRAISLAAEFMSIGEQYYWRYAFALQARNDADDKHIGYLTAIKNLCGEKYEPLNELPTFETHKADFKQLSRIIPTEIFLKLKK
jgi:hypothetical protein